jgi:hypothetical protein
MIDAHTYAVSRIGSYSGILGPYALDGLRRYAVKTTWGMQVANLKRGEIVTAAIPGNKGDLSPGNSSRYK